MISTRGIAVAAMLAGFNVGTASSAWADPPAMSGHYIETQTTPQGQTKTNDWYVASCGNGCANVTTRGQTLQARLVDNQWTMDQDNSAACSDGTKVSGAESVHETWDPYTLAGTMQVTDKFPVCGASTPETSTNKVQLKLAP
jgi:hypothetical protein